MAYRQARAPQGKYQVFELDRWKPPDEARTPLSVHDTLDAAKAAIGGVTEVDGVTYIVVRDDGRIAFRSWRG